MEIIPTTLHKSFITVTWQRIKMTAVKTILIKFFRSVNLNATVSLSCLFLSHAAGAEEPNQKEKSPPPFSRQEPPLQPPSFDRNLCGEDEDYNSEFF